MKKLVPLLTVVVLAMSCAMSLFFVSGCDVSSSTDALTISPSSATVSPGQDVIFNVTGGYTYTWSLSPDDGSGILSSQSGSQVTYTCLSTNISTKDSSAKKVMVTSTIPGSGTGSSNSPAYEVSGSANIYYVNGMGGGDTTPALVIKPDHTVTVLTNGTMAFSATGGVPPYSWNVLDSNLGSILPATTIADGITTYKRTASNSNTVNKVILQDSAGVSKEIAINQP
ncbi:MAG: hypothetical protein WCL49_11330 [bacterium]